MLQRQREAGQLVLYRGIRRDDVIGRGTRLMTSFLDHSSLFIPTPTYIYIFVLIIFLYFSILYFPIITYCTHIFYSDNNILLLLYSVSVAYKYKYTYTHIYLVPFVFLYQRVLKIKNIFIYLYTFIHLLHLAFTFVIFLQHPDIFIYINYYIIRVLERGPMTLGNANAGGGFQFIKTTVFSIMTNNKIVLEKQAIPP